MDFSDAIRALGDAYELRDASFEDSVFAGAAKRLVFAGVTFARCRFAAADFSGSEFSGCVSTVRAVRCA